MELIKIMIPAAITLGLALLGVTFGYGKLNQKVKGMRGDIDEQKEDHSIDMLAVHSEIGKMKVEHAKDMSDLNDKMDKMDDKNSRQHEKLFDISNNTNAMVAKIEGYLMAKKEQDD